MRKSKQQVARIVDVWKKLDPKDPKIKAALDQGWEIPQVLAERRIPGPAYAPAPASAAVDQHNARERQIEAKGAMGYPDEFSDRARAEVEAERLQAIKQLDRKRRQVPWSSYGPAAADEQNLRTYILRVFLAWVKQACKLDSWTVDRIRSEAEEFLHTFTIEAYYEQGHDQDGRKLREMTSNLTGSILSEVDREFRQSAEWRKYERALLRVAKARLERKAPEHAEPRNSRPAYAPATARATIRDLLAKKGWSTKDWADHSKVDFHTADDYLKGTTHPFKSTRKKLAESLDLQVDNLPR